MREFTDSNDGCNYLLCVIDCFSKYAWVEPLKTKTGAETTKAVESIFNKGRIPAKLQVDNGKEYYNTNVESLLKNNNIEYFSTFSDKKAAMAERFNRTLKSRMWKYFTTNETRKWIDIVQQLVNDYNNSSHSTVKMTPVEASKPENYAAGWTHVYGAYFTAKYETPQYKLGQTAKINIRAYSTRVICLTSLKNFSKLKK